MTCLFCFVLLSYLKQFYLGFTITAHGAQLKLSLLNYSDNMWSQILNWSHLTACFHFQKKNDSNKLIERRFPRHPFDLVWEFSQFPKNLSFIHINSIISSFMIWIKFLFPLQYFWSSYTHTINFMWRIHTHTLHRCIEEAHSHAISWHSFRYTTINLHLASI